MAANEVGRNSFLAPVGCVFRLPGPKGTTVLHSPSIHVKGSHEMIILRLEMRKRDKKVAGKYAYV